jgi:hypothetical protein
VGFGIIGFESNGLTDQLHGDIVPSELMRDYAEIMQCLGVARFHRQNLPVERLRLCKPSRLVVLKGNLEGLLNRHGLADLPRRAGKEIGSDFGFRSATRQG